MAWTFQSAHAEQWNGSDYVEDDWSMPVYTKRSMRFWFRISGTSFGEPYAPGDFRMQIDRGSGWVNWQNARLVNPFLVVGFAEQPGVYITVLYMGESVAGVYPIRLEVAWPGGPYYGNVITVTITSVQPPIVPPNLGNWNVVNRRP